MSRSLALLSVALHMCICQAELKCAQGSEGYWALDKPNDECAEACLTTAIQRSVWWVITGGQGHPAENASSPCADHGFHKFDRTDVVGEGPLKLSLNKYLPDKVVQATLAKNKCALACTSEAIGVYWACAAACIAKQEADSCITEECPALVTAYDVKCLKGCNASDVEEPQVAVASCDVGGSSLCSCSELIEKKLIKSFDDCTQEAAMSACSRGQCQSAGQVETQVPVTLANSTTRCCDGDCVLPTVKYFSTDAPHGFCGEACMDPAKFSIYHKFEANLTRATGEHPCSKQWTPDNSKQYTDYFSTMTHGFPGVLTVTLDLYAPTGMPDHSCCDKPRFVSLNCVGIPGKPLSLTIAGTGPYCCPSTATETAPCPSNYSAMVII